MIYCFRNVENDEYIELDFPMGSCPELIKLHENKYRRSMKDENVSFSMKTTQGFPDQSLAVNELQIPEFKKELRDAGLGDTEVTNEGIPVCKDLSHQRKIAEMRYGEEAVTEKIEKGKKNTFVK